MLHVISLRFEHRLGNQIDQSYPPLPDMPYIDDWNQGLPFIAIPDKAHDNEHSVIQFTLPDPTQPKGFVYCISCYLAIESSKLENHDESIIRNHMQKSLCAISKVPFNEKFQGIIEKRLKDNFEDLNSILEDLFNELNDALQDESSKRYAAIDCSFMINQLKGNVLSLIKSLMIGQRILVYANHSEEVSKFCYAIASLFPGYFYEDEKYPYKFMEDGNNVYSFVPYVPLQFSDLLNDSKAKSVLMGTCSELFLVQPIVKYDILIDNRTTPATITGKLPKLEENEMKFINSIIELNPNDETFREKLRYWFDSLFGAFLRIRNINEVPNYIWPFLDLDVVNSFNKDFISSLMSNPSMIDIVSKCDLSSFPKLEEQILKKQKKPVFS